MWSQPHFADYNDENYLKHYTQDVIPFYFQFHSSVKFGIVSFAHYFPPKISAVYKKPIMDGTNLVKMPNIKPLWVCFTYGKNIYSPQVKILTVEQTSLDEWY